MSKFVNSLRVSGAWLSCEEEGAGRSRLSLHSEHPGQGDMACIIGVPIGDSEKRGALQSLPGQFSWFPVPCPRCTRKT